MGHPAKKPDEKKQASEQSPVKAKDQSTQEQVASPELEAAMQGNAKQQPEQKPAGDRRSSPRGSRRSRSVKKQSL